MDKKNSLMHFITTNVTAPPKPLDLKEWERQLNYHREKSYEYAQGNNT